MSTATDYTPDQAGHYDLAATLDAIDNAPDVYESPRPVPNTDYWQGQAWRENRERDAARLGWVPTIAHGDFDVMHAGMLLHECEDGHHWREWPDGTVGPSWGYGLTRIAYPGWNPARCPEPERGHSRYDDGGPDHGYKCPTCGTVHYVGGCGTGVRTDPWNEPDEPCAPPPPCCGKPPVRTSRWFSPSRADRKRGVAAGWRALDAEPEPGEQIALDL